MTAERSLATISRERPVLIAGPTASGKSALAMELAARDGRLIVNADALQVYDCWRILTARPSARTRPPCPMRFMAMSGGPSRGRSATGCARWRRLLDRPVVIVGGTGLYLQRADRRAGRDPARAPRNPRRGRGVAGARRPCRADRGPRSCDGRANRPPEPGARPARLGGAAGHGPGSCRLAGRYRRAPAARSTGRNAAGDARPRRAGRPHPAPPAGHGRRGRLAEVAAELPHWDPARPSGKAIGVAEFAACLRGEITAEAAITAAATATRQYAKRQRSWFRGRMRDWRIVAT
jgi:tRNA dimethylallyltransferase